MCVIPNVLGCCVFSPPLDVTGNSIRGMAFIQELVQRHCGFTAFNKFQSSQALARTQRTIYREFQNNFLLFYAVEEGDMMALRRLYLNGANVAIVDYDGCSPLHLAVMYGHLEITQYLLEKGADAHQADRWGTTPLQQAMKTGPDSPLLALFHQYF